VTTVRDGGEFRGEVFDFGAFLEARAAQRSRQAANLAQRRREYQEARAALARAHQMRTEALLRDGGLSKEQRLDLQAHARRELEADEQATRVRYADAVAGDRPATPFVQWLRDRAESAANRTDYVEYLKSIYSEKQATVIYDPVIVSIPGSRRRRSDGMHVYTLTDRWGSERELLRVAPDSREVIVRDTKNDRALEASIVHAHHQFGGPLTFESADPKFIERCVDVAVRYGFAYQTNLVERPTVDAAARSGPAAPAAPSASPGATTAAAGEDRTTAPRGPAIAVADYGGLTEALEENGIDFYSPLTTDWRGALEGEFLGAVPHVDDAKYSVAAVRTPNGAALIAILNDRLAGAEVGEKIRATAVDGEWQAVAIAPIVEPGVPRAEGPEPGQERGGRGR
jgi:hypothetical protein